MDFGNQQPIVDQHHLRLVLAIISTGSVTKAADALHVTQPALSHQLRQLEVRLRTPLFVRTAKGMVATPAGERLKTLAQTVLPAIDNFEREILSGDYSAARGKLRLATQCYTAYHWLPTVLKAFHTRWPAVDLQVAAEYTGATIPALRDGALDLAILHNAPRDRRIRTDPLFEDELVVVTAPQHVFADRAFVVPEDFENEHLYLYATVTGESQIMRDILDPAGVVPARTTRLQLTDAILQLVAADMGVAILARWAVAPFSRAGLVRVHRLTESGIFRHWTIATRRDDPAPAFRHDLIELLRTHVGNGPILHGGVRIA